MLKQPLHLQVSAVTDGARRAIEAAGGSVTTVYYNRLGLRALLKVSGWEWGPLCCVGAVGAGGPGGQLANAACAGP
jgi:hypothetical protein